MDADDPVYDFARSILFDLMAVLYINGIRKLPVGAAMRMMGVHNDNAAAHDDEWIEIEENFNETIQQLNIAERLMLTAIPQGTTLH